MHSRILVLGAGFAGLEHAARFPGVYAVGDVATLVAEKTHFGASRQARWFGR